MLHSQVFEAWDVRLFCQDAERVEIRVDIAEFLDFANQEVGDVYVAQAVGTDGGGGGESGCATARDQIVLVHAVAADSDSADQHAILIKRHAAGKDRDSVLQV